MKKLLFALAVVGAFAPSLSQAQVKIDMTKITCGQVLEMSPDLRSDYAAWMSGWFAQKSGRTFIDLGLFHKNYDSVMSWCESNKSESVMAGLQRAFEKK
jgi:hypothetical protein